MNLKTKKILIGISAIIAICLTAGVVQAMDMFQNEQVGRVNVAYQMIEGKVPIADSSSDSEVTVYITKTGAKYHLYGCKYLKKSCIPVTLSQAKAWGYTPCKVCKPPK